MNKNDMERIKKQLEEALNGDALKRLSEDQKKGLLKRMEKTLAQLQEFSKTGEEPPGGMVSFLENESRELKEFLGGGADIKIMAFDSKKIGDNYEKVTGLPFPKNNTQDIVDTASVFDVTGALYKATCEFINRACMKKNPMSIFAELTERLESPINIFGVDNTVLSETFPDPQGDETRILSFVHLVSETMFAAIEYAKENSVTGVEAKNLIERAVKNCLSRFIEMSTEAAKLSGFLSHCLDVASLEQERVETISSHLTTILKKYEKEVIESEIAPRGHVETLDDILDYSKTQRLAGKFGFLCILRNLGIVSEEDYLTSYREINNAIIGL